MFSIYVKKNKVNIAERFRFPIHLAYGITIHKSQGMTLKGVIVSCDDILQQGQLSVAIGRATSIDGLQLIGYKEGLCNARMNVFYNSITPQALYEGLSRSLWTNVNKLTITIGFV